MKTNKKTLARQQLKNIKKQVKTILASCEVGNNKAIKYDKIIAYIDNGNKRL